MKSTRTTLTLILGLLLFPSFLVRSQTIHNKDTPQGTLSFFITDSEKGHGVASEIYIKGPDHTFALKTNSGGHLDFSNSIGKHEITILSEGYASLETYFYIEAGATINIQTILEKSNLSTIERVDYESPVVQGYVIDEETGFPLANVKVELLDEKIFAQTDENGFFTLEPTQFSEIIQVEDKAVRSDFIFSKKGYSSHTIKNLLMIPDQINVKVYLKKGKEATIETYHQNVLDQTEKDIENYEKSVPKEKPNSSNYSPKSSSCNIPSSIRVGTSCSCTNCSSVQVMSLQYYSESGLDDEWISSWNAASLEAGSIPYRTYGGYYVNNPVKPNFDIASSTCNQVWGSTVYNNTASAAQATSGKVLTANNSTPARSEYSAENNYGGTQYNCSNSYAGGSGAYSCHLDNLCSGKNPAGHGRGMCQWGTQRWALNGKTYMWMINHYFVNTIGYSICEEIEPPTQLNISQSPDCNNGATFTWTNSADNWTVQISTDPNFNNYSSKTISSGTSTSAPNGFSPAITWQPFTIYYWRIVYSNGSKNGSSFTYDQCDDTPPTTEVLVTNDWKTEDFVVEFNDADESGGSGIAKSFYQVLFYDGNAWKANPNRGFYADNFDGNSIDTLWTEDTGSWNITSNNKLEQNDETIYNSNIYAPLIQDLSNRYLYTWNGKISGSDPNRRAGLHFFCDNPAQNERGNSYLVYFRTDGNPDPANNNKVQIYKAEGNNLTLKKSVSHTINADQWYVYKVAFDRITGEMFVYVDGEVVAAWTDSNPHQSGDAVSFRSGNSIYQVDNFKAYRTRYPQVDVTVGPGTQTDVPFQNPDPTTPSAKVKSIVMDNAANLSSVAYEFVNVDWTVPEGLIVNDGSNTDIDTTYSSLIEANWGTTNDSHSGIAAYKIAIGTTPGSADVVAWNSNGTNTDYSSSISNLNYNQIYYISVAAENGAGLIDTVTSDGQMYVDENALSIEKEELEKIKLYPNPVLNELQFENLENSAHISIYDTKGKLVLQSKIDHNQNKVNVSNLAKATYSIMIQIRDQLIVKRFVKN